MKKIGISAFIIVVLVFIVFCGYLYIKPRYLDKGIEINKDNFPDDNLREFAMKRDKKNDGNGYLSTYEIETLHTIELEGCENLKGIENFTAVNIIKLTSCNDISAINALENLTTIELKDCKNIDVDLCNYTSLKKLVIDSCELKYDIDFNGMESLQEISIDESTVGKICISNCPELKKGIFYRSKLEEISITDCPKFEYYEVLNNTNLKKHTIENCPKIWRVSLCGCSEINSLEVNECEKLYEIDLLRNDSLTEVTVKGCPVIDEALNDTDNLEKYIAKDGIIYLDHENSASISYTGDVKFITE